MIQKKDGIIPSYLFQFIRIIPLSMYDWSYPRKKILGDLFDLKTYSHPNQLLFSFFFSSIDE